MNKIKEYSNLFNSEVKVSCTDGSAYMGFWSEFFEEDYFEEGEASFIIMELEGGIPMEILVSEIEQISEA